MYRSVKGINGDHNQSYDGLIVTVRLLQALVDLSGLKIINSRVIDLTKINAVVDDSPD